jgi:hypothetical protein
MSQRTFRSASLAVLVLVCVVIYFSARSRPPSASAQLATAWSTLLSTATKPLATLAPREAAALATFSGTLDHLSLPAADERAGRALEATTTALRKDLRAGNFVTGSTRCPADTTGGCWVYPPRYTSDDAAFNADFRALATALGGG